jgi:UDP-N-acetylglucosamine 2-epimerase (non-hydrolysing)
MNGKILFCLGTRPEWLKIKPILRLLDRDKYKILFTGQHEDLLKDIEFDYEIVIYPTKKARINREIGNRNRLNDIISCCLNQFPTDDSFNSVLVQGDTASAYACALAAFNKGLKIYYLEAGLRSYNLKHPYPEEAYRQMISRISDVNFCPTDLSMENLESERVGGKNFVVGNTVLDNLVGYKDKCEYTNKVLVTLHRRENHALMEEWFTVLNDIAKKYDDLEFIIPIHPNPNVIKHKNLLTNLTVVDPMSHDDLLELLVKCKFVISDSGGLQEEGSFFNKKVIVCRETTERPEGKLSGHLHMCPVPAMLPGEIDKINKNHYINSPCLYGDGNSSKRIVGILHERN